MNDDTKNLGEEWDLDNLEDWKPPLSYKVWKWFHDTWFGTHYYNIKGGIAGLWKWRKIAWGDRDWDHDFIYKTLQFKIKNTADYLETHDRFVGCSEEVTWMRRCVILIDKVSNTEYDGEYMDYHETNFRFEDLDEKPGFSELHLDTLKENLDDYLNKYPLCKKRAIQYLKDNKEKWNKDHTDKKMVAMIMGDLRQAKAKKLLFDIIHWKIERWWD